MSVRTITGIVVIIAGTFLLATNVFVMMVTNWRTTADLVKVRVFTFSNIDTHVGELFFLSTLFACI